MNTRRLGRRGHLPLPGITPSLLTRGEVAIYIYIERQNDPLTQDPSCMYPSSPGTVVA